MASLAIATPAAVFATEAPSYWDPRHRPERPDLRTISGIRFLTEDEYPPFNYAGSGGVLEGFNIDISRAICAELALTCTIQVRRFDLIISALEAGEGDAVVASLTPSDQLRSLLRFSSPYYRTPARFVARKDSPRFDTAPKALAGKRVAVVAGSAHEAFLADFFPAVERVPRETASGAREALVKGGADLLFGDGITLSFWLNGEASKACCRFVGEPYGESRYFGEGVSIALRKTDAPLEKAIDYALFRLWERGVYADIWRRWFPVNPYGLDP